MSEQRPFIEIRTSLDEEGEILQLKKRIADLKIALELAQEAKEKEYLKEQISNLDMQLGNKEAKKRLAPETAKKEDLRALIKPGVDQVARGRGEDVSLTEKSRVGRYQELRDYLEKNLLPNGRDPRVQKTLQEVVRRLEENLSRETDPSVRELLQEIISRARACLGDELGRRALVPPEESVERLREEAEPGEIAGLREKIRRLERIYQELVEQGGVVEAQDAIRRKIRGLEEKLIRAELAKLQADLKQEQDKLISTPPDLIDSQKAKIAELERLIKEKEDEWARREGFEPPVIFKEAPIVIEKKEKVEEEEELGGPLKPYDWGGKMKEYDYGGPLKPYDYGGPLVKREKEVEKEKYYIADISPIVERYANELAKSKVNEVLLKGHWYSRWIPAQGEKWLMEFYRKEIIKKMSDPKVRNLLIGMATERLGGKVSFESTASSQAINYEILDAVMEAYVKDLALESEKSGDLVNDGEVNETLAAIFTGYAIGKISSRQEFDREIQEKVIAKILEKGYKFAPGDKEAEALGLMYANNFFELAEGYKKYVAEELKEAGQEFGEEQRENIEKHIKNLTNFDIQLGTKERDLYETKPNEVLKWYEKMVDWTKSYKYLNKIFANPLSYAVVGGVLGNRVGQGIARLAGLGAGAAVVKVGAGVGVLAAAPWLAPFIIGACTLGGAALASGAYLKWRRQRDLQYDRGQALRERTLGVELPAEEPKKKGFFRRMWGGVSRFLGGGTERKVREFVYDIKAGQDVLQDLSPIKDKIKVAGAGAERAALGGADWEVVADSIARLNVQRKQQVDLIYTSREMGDKYKTKYIEVKDQEGKIIRKGLAEVLVREDLRDILNSVGLNLKDFEREKEEEIAHTGDAKTLADLIKKREQQFGENIAGVDKNFDKYKRQEGNKALLVGTLFGIAGGTAGQQAFKGLCELLPVDKIPLFGKYISLKGKQTWLERFGEALRGKQSPGAAVVEGVATARGTGVAEALEAYPKDFNWSDFNTGKGKLTLPDFLGHKDSTSGNFISGQPSAEGIWYDQAGKEIYNPQTGQVAGGWTMEQTKGPYEGGRRVIPPDDWLKDVKPTPEQKVVNIDREGWYTQDTERIDFNEKRFHWGGVHRTGLDKNGNIVMDLSRMKAHDSWNTALGKPQGAVDVQELVARGKEGPIKLIFSAASGKEKIVFEASLSSSDGKIVFAPGSDGAKFFKILAAPNERGVLVDILAKHIEVVQELRDENGVVHFIAIATESGQGLQGIEITDQFNDYKLIPPAEVVPPPPPPPPPPPIRSSEVVPPWHTPAYGRRPLAVEEAEGEKKAGVPGEEGKGERPPVKGPEKPPVVGPYPEEKSPENIKGVPTPEEAEKFFKKWEEAAGKEKQVAVRGGEEELLPSPPHQEEYLGAEFPRKFKFQNPQELAGFIIKNPSLLTGADRQVISSLPPAEQVSVIQEKIDEEIKAVDTLREQFREYIQDSRAALQKTLEKYGVKDFYFPKDEDIYLCGRYLYQAQSQERIPYSLGLSYIVDGAIFVNLEELNSRYPTEEQRRAKFKEVLIHEIVHDASSHNYWHFTAKGGVDEYYPRRRGLMFWRGRTPYAERGRGLTEAVTQDLALEGVREIFPNWPDDGVYKGEREVLDILLKKYEIPKEYFVQSLTDRKSLVKLVRRMEGVEEKQAVGPASFSIMAGLMNYEASQKQYGYPLTRAFLEKQPLNLPEEARPHLPTYLFKAGQSGSARVQEQYPFVSLGWKTPPDIKVKLDQEAAEKKETGDIKKVMDSVKELWGYQEGKLRGRLQYDQSLTEEAKHNKVIAIREIRKEIDLMNKVINGQAVSPVADSEIIKTLLQRLDKFANKEEGYDLDDNFASLRIPESEKSEYLNNLARLQEWGESDEMP